MTDAGDGDAAFLHRFEQGGLCFRRGAVDFVGEQEIGENGAALETELPPGTVRIFFQNLGSENIGGHQIGSELDAFALEFERAGERTGHERLGQAGRADEQTMAAGEQGD